mgnify:CR=1 FL=1
MGGSGQVHFVLADRARSEGARSMRAVKGRLGHPSNESDENWKVFVLVHSTSRRASGWAGEKVVRSEGRFAYPLPLEKVKSQKVIK